ncbi:MAG: J domain-containing protein, partial [Microcoleaceae cyanobacterium]
QPTAEELQADQMYRPNRQRVSYTPRQTGWESEEPQAPIREPRETREPEPRIPRQNIEAVLTLSLERAYVGGIERIKLEDGMTVEVDLPAAMITGQQIRLRGQGKGGGDLYLKIIVSEHPFFQLEGSDIFCELPITPCEAVLGGEIEVPTIDGLVKVKLPPGVSHGQRLRLANKGYPDGQGERGDQLVELVLVTTKDISPEEKELYEKIREIEQFKPRQDLPV